MTDTDDQTRRLISRLFGRDEPDSDEIVRDRLANPKPKPSGNVVPGEGDNPDPGVHFSREDYLRQLARELFNPRLAATDPVTFDVNP